MATSLGYELQPGARWRVKHERGVNAWLEGPEGVHTSDYLSGSVRARARVWRGVQPPEGPLTAAASRPRPRSVLRYNTVWYFPG